MRADCASAKDWSETKRVYTETRRSYVPQESASERAERYRYEQEARLQAAQIEQYKLERERQKIADERARQKRLAIHYTKLMTWNADEAKDEFSLNFLNSMHEDKDSHPADEKTATLLDEFAKNAFVAINNSDVKALSIYLGPLLQDLHQDFLQENYKRYKQWLKSTPGFDFNLKAMRFVQWYARKSLYGFLWQEYEGQIKAKQHTLSLSTETKALETTTEETKQETSNLQQQTIAQYEKMQSLYANLESIYQKQGLQAYYKTLTSQPYKELLTLFNNLLQPHYKKEGDEEVLFNGKTDLSQSQKDALIAAVQKEFTIPGLKLSGLALAAPDAKTTGQASERSVTSSVAQKASEQKAEHKSIPKPESQAQLLSLSSPLIASTETKERKETKKAIVASYQIGDTEWCKHYQLVLAEQQRPQASTVINGLQWLLGIINSTTSLAEILYKLSSHCDTGKNQYAQFQREQKNAEEVYRNKCSDVEKNFKEEAMKWFKEDGDEKATAIIQSQIGKLSMTADCFYNADGIHLIHAAMKKFKESGTPKNLQVIEHLLARRASPYTLKKTKNIDGDEEQVTAFQYAWGENPAPHWDVLSLTFKHMLQLNPLAEKICQFAVTYCTKSKKDEAGLFYGLFHSRAIKTDRGRDLAMLGQYIFDANTIFDGKPLLIWLKFKCSVFIKPEERRHLKITTEKPAKRSKSSSMYKTLLQYVNEVDAGLLEYFPTIRDHQLLEISPSFNLEERSATSTTIRPS